MGKYGIIAVEAVKLLQRNKSTDYLAAWNEAAQGVFDVESPSYKKGCPRNAYIGLCEVGLIKGVAGLPTQLKGKEYKNKGYALKAVELLRSEGSLEDDKSKLWELVVSGERKQHNGQLDVVLALWKSGIIILQR